MRLVTTLANLLVIFVTVCGAPVTHVFGATNGAYPVRQATTVETFATSPPPAEAAAPRERARTRIAAISRFIPFQLGILAAALLRPALSLSDSLIHATDTLSAFASLSTSFVRGPPLVN